MLASDSQTEHAMQDSEFGTKYGDEELLIPNKDAESIQERKSENRERFRSNLRRKIRDLLVRRALEAFICFHIDRSIPFATAFQRLLTEHDGLLIIERLKKECSVAGIGKLRANLELVQRRLRIKKSQQLRLEAAIEQALPAWRRGSLGTEDVRRRVTDTAKSLLRGMSDLPEKEREMRYEKFASLRNSQQLVRHGAVRLEELRRYDPRLLTERGELRAHAYDVVEELRLLVLLRDTRPSRRVRKAV